MISVSDVKKMGFAPSMYGIDEAELDARITDVIDDVSGQLSLRVGATRFTDPANEKAADAAVKLKCAIEMAWRRIISLSANTRTDPAESSEAETLRKAVAAWEEQAEAWLQRIITGTLADTDGFSSSVTVSASAARMQMP